MSARIIDGKAVAARIRAEVAGEIERMDVTPGLATVLVGDDPASAVYVRMKREDSAEVGIESFHHEPGGDVSAGELSALLRDLNADERDRAAARGGRGARGRPGRGARALDPRRQAARPAPAGGERHGDALP